MDESAPRMSETKILASYILSNRLEDIPEDVRYEARRAILNYLGCALGGSQQEDAHILLAHYQEMSESGGPPLRAGSSGVSETTPARRATS